MFAAKLRSILGVNFNMAQATLERSTLKNTRTATKLKEKAELAKVMGPEQVLDKGPTSLSKKSEKNSAVSEKTCVSGAGAHGEKTTQPKKPDSSVKKSVTVDVLDRIMDRLEAIESRQVDYHSGFQHCEVTQTTDNILPYPENDDYYDFSTCHYGDYEDDNNNDNYLGCETAIQCGQREPQDTLSMMSDNTNRQNPEHDTEPQDVDMFANFSKRYCFDEICSKSVNNNLAEMVNKLFREGLSEDKFQEMVKASPRPENCDGLAKIKVNQLVWNIIPTQARSCDVVFQNLQTSIVKSATIITKLADKMVSLNDHKLVESALDALALLGHANKQLVHSRRSALKPVIQSEFGHLCSPTVPYTNLLFGDDVSKNVKDIKDMEKLKKMMRKGAMPTRGGRFHPYPMRGRGRGFRGRSDRGKFHPNAQYNQWPRFQPWQAASKGVTRPQTKKD